MMMPHINTLVDDVQALLRDKKIESLDEEALGHCVKNIMSSTVDAITEDLKTREPNVVYVTEASKPCHRQTWYAINGKGIEVEKLPGKAEFKFLYGNILEHLFLYLAKETGHRVQDEQTACSMKKEPFLIKGRIDAVIDGVLVDVKSVSPMTFEKFSRNKIQDDDAFGYLMQMGIYQAMLKVDRAALVPINKVDGKIMVYCIGDLSVKAEHKLTVLAHDLAQSCPPKRAFELVPEGTSGNKKLPVACSYCPFKFECWGSELRVFSYSSGPVFLAEVRKEPKVPDMTKEWKERNMR